MSRSSFREKERLQWQCRRGMLELDCLLRRFLDEQYEHLSEESQARFRRLLREADPHIYRWLLTAPTEVPEQYAELLRAIRAAT